MKKYKIISLFKKVLDQPILLITCTFIFLCFYESQFTLTLVITVGFWYLRTRDNSWIIFAIFLSCLSIPRYNTTMPSSGQAKVIRVQQSYAILQDHRTFFIVYTDEPLFYDDVYSYNGEFTEIVSSTHFYGFDYERWAHQLHAYYSTNQENITLISTGRSPLHWIQEKIQENDALDEQVLLNKILLNISSDASEDSWYRQFGFSFSGYLGIISLVLSYLFHEKPRRIIVLTVMGFSWYFYHYPILVFMMIINQVLYYFPFNRVCRISYGIFITMVCYPHSILSISFLIPTIIRLSVLIEKKRKIKMYFAICIVQSIFFNQINIVQSLLFRLMQRIFGVLFFFGIFDMMFEFTFLARFSNFLQLLFIILDRFIIYGNCLGFTLPFFVILFMINLNKKYVWEVSLTMFVILLVTGLFHPLGEYTMINVGQGSAALIRMPFNSCNILIDTGKPSSYTALETYLYAKGITHLDGLIITHGDDDHAGNQDQVIENFHPDTVITEHQFKTVIKNFTMYDLNQLNSDDENQSSIVSLFSLNGLCYLTTGDCDTYAEKIIVEQYNKLDIDVYVAGHHGSKTSSSDVLLDTIQPDICLISSGAYEIYHHPSPETIQKLLKRHIPYFDTKQEGDVSIISIAKWNVLITSTMKISLIHQ